MSVRAEIWLADLLEVMDRLEIADGDALAHAVRVLDIQLPRRDDVPLDAGLVGPEGGDAPAPTTMAESLVAEEIERVAAPVPDHDVRPPELSPVGHAPWPDEVDWTDADLLDELPGDLSRGLPPHLPLLDPLGTIPILNAALATPGPGEEVDFAALLDAVVSARPVTEIPYLDRPSLCRGVRVLVDTGESMQLFARDQAELLERLDELIGDEQLEVHWFERSPTRGCGPGGAGGWRPFEPPLPGTPVLVLGTLGIGLGARAFDAEWLEIAGTLRRRGSRLIALVPLGADRVPEELRRAIDVVVWDRATAISDLTFRIRR